MSEFEFGPPLKMQRYYQTTDFADDPLYKWALPLGTREVFRTLTGHALGLYRREDEDRPRRRNLIVYATYKWLIEQTGIKRDALSDHLKRLRDVRLIVCDNPSSGRKKGFEYFIEPPLISEYDWPKLKNIEHSQYWKFLTAQRGKGSEGAKLRLLFQSYEASQDEGPAWVEMLRLMHWLGADDYPVPPSLPEYQNLKPQILSMMQSGKPTTNNAVGKTDYFDLGTTQSGKPTTEKMMQSGKPTSGVGETDYLEESPGTTRSGKPTLILLSYYLLISGQCLAYFFPQNVPPKKKRSIPPGIQAEIDAVKLTGSPKTHDAPGPTPTNRSEIAAKEKAAQMSLRVNSSGPADAVLPKGAPNGALDSDGDGETSKKPFPRYEQRLVVLKMARTDRKISEAEYDKSLLELCKEFGRPVPVVATGERIAPKEGLSARELGKRLSPKETLRLGLAGKFLKENIGYENLRAEGRTLERDTECEDFPPPEKPVSGVEKCNDHA